MGRRIPVRCFTNEPSLNSSLKFLRKTPWARAQVEALYVTEFLEAEKKQKRNKRRAARRAFAAEMPVERDETLAFFWPVGMPAPTWQLPQGFELKPGVQRVDFVAVQAAIGFDISDAMWQELDLVPEAMVVVHDEHGPVATAAALQAPNGWAELAWVAVAPQHRGKGLGRLVSAFVVAHLLQAGHERIIGSTQDARIQALGIYLKMGFKPVWRSEKAERWTAVQRLVGRGE